MSTTKKKTAKKQPAKSEATTLTPEEQAQLTGETAIERSQNPTDVMLNKGATLSGDTDNESIRLPRLNLVQKVGPLADKFNKGEIVLNQEEVLVDGTKTPLEVTAVKAHYFYEENLPYGDDRLPERAKDVAEVNARGGVLDWIDGVAPTWRKVAETLFCVKSPEGMEESPSFPFKFSADGDPASGSYTFALLKLKGSSYNSAGKELLAASRFYYRKGLSTGSFSMTAELTKFRTGNSAYVCTLRKNKNHSEEFLGWLSDYQP